MRRASEEASESRKTASVIITATATHHDLSNVAGPARTARQPERGGNGDEDDRRVDAAAISFPEDLQHGMRDVQTELIVTSNALGGILGEGQGRLWGGESAHR